MNLSCQFVRDSATWITKPLGNYSNYVFLSVFLSLCFFALNDKDRLIIAYLIITSMPYSLSLSLESIFKDFLYVHIFLTENFINGFGGIQGLFELGGKIG